MCGIIAGIKPLEAHITPDIVEGLKRLQYRGYDSYGILVARTDYTSDAIPQVFRSTDKEIIGPLTKRACNLGMGHTRWATHGEASHENTHPIPSNDGSIYVVHNGTIDNVEEIRNFLAHRKIYSSNLIVDTQLIANLLEYYVNLGCSLTFANKQTANMLSGNSSYVFYHKNAPNELHFHCNGQPLHIAKSEDGVFVASDADAFPDEIVSFSTLSDTACGTLYLTLSKTLAICHVYKGTTIPHMREKLNRTQLGEAHHMLSEIKEQVRLAPQYLKRTVDAFGAVYYGCGSSYYAGMFGKYFGQQVEYSTELKWGNIDKNKHYVAISQSGETYDTIEATKYLLSKDTKGISLITNNPSSTLAKLIPNVYNINIGKEIGVAATKTFLGSVMAVIGSSAVGLKMDDSMQEAILQLSDSLHLKNVGVELSKYRNALVLGHRFNYPVALEGALKLKEIAYIHAEGMLASEMKHGPIALIDKDTISIFIVDREHNPKILSNINEIKARGGKILTIAHISDRKVSALSDYFIGLTQDNLGFTLEAVVALQLLAYHAAVAKGINPDQPRNLAKSVTV